MRNDRGQEDRYSVQRVQNQPTQKNRDQQYRKQINRQEVEYQHDNQQIRKPYELRWQHHQSDQNSLNQRENLYPQQRYETWRRDTCDDYNDSSSYGSNGSGFTNKKCYKCGETGHISVKCRHNNPLHCWTCQKYGHKSKDCWYRFD